MKHSLLRLANTTYLEIKGEGFSLSINLGDVSPKNGTHVQTAIREAAEEAEFNAEKYQRRARRIREVLARMDNKYHGEE